jgi:hypothetical protein
MNYFRDAIGERPSSVTPSTFLLLPELLPAGAGTLQRDRHHHNGNFYLLAGGRWVELPIERRRSARFDGNRRLELSMNRSNLACCGGLANAWIELRRRDPDGGGCGMQ